VIWVRFVILRPGASAGSDNERVRRIQVHGHRGARALRPENTLAAFEYAIAAGVDAIELDVAVTRDDVVVVSHDPVLEGPLCMGPMGVAGERAIIRETPFDEVRRWDCGSVRHPDFPRQVLVPGARIPSLDEVFRLAGGFRWNIEIKSFPEHPDLTPAPAEFARLVVESIRGNGVDARVMVQSFDFRVLHEVPKLLPEIPLGALFEEDADFVAITRSAKAGFVAPRHVFVTAAKVKQAHRAGLAVIPWTANEEPDWERLTIAGVDGIITDDPAALIAYLDRISH
jgi:glycerophosphoryl diester phosphodiesterase